MATISGNDVGNRRKQPSAQNASGTAPSAASSQTKPRRHRWLRFLLLGTVVLLAVVALAPTIIANTPLAALILRKAAPVNGSIAMRSISLGWFSAPQVWGLELRDAQNQPVLAVDHIAAPATLVNLILGRTGGGTLLIEKPKLTLVLSASGSNLEDTLSTLLNSSTSSSTSSPSTGFDLNVVMSDGEASVTEKTTGQSWHISGMQAAVATARGQMLPTKIELAAALDQAQQPGSVSLKFHTQPNTTPSKESLSLGGLAQTSGDLNLAATNFPLAVADRIVARAMPGVHLAGTLGAALSAQWTNLNQVKLQGDVTAAQLELASPWTGADTLRLDKAHAACQAVRADRQVSVSQLLVESDVGNCSAATQLDLGDGGWAALPAALEQQQGKLQGVVDIARLAQRLPNTMRIRPGTQITSGQLQFSLQAGGNSAGQSWQAQLHTSQLAAIDQGKAINWNQPIQAALLAHQTPQGVVVDQLSGESDFGKFSATGTFAQLNVKVTADLKQLADKLGQFVDLGGASLAGQGDGTLQWTHAANGDFNAGGDFQVKNLHIGIPGQKPWSDDLMHVVLTSRGITDFAARSRVDSCKLQFHSSVDQFDVTLAAPLALSSMPTAVAFQLSWQGRLDAVTHRLPVSVSLPMLQSTGNYQVLAEVQASKDAITVQQGRLALGQPNVAGQDYNVVQPSAEFGFAGRVDLHTGQLDIPSAQFSGSARWQNATAYGMQIGPGELHAKLVNGVLQTDPLQLTCNQGQLSLAPQVRLSPAPMQLNFGAGTLASQVQFDPALCRSGMERIMPILASVTQAQGVMSVQLQGVRVPLLDPSKTEAAGQIIVHSAQLQPGPLAQQLALLSTTPISITQLKPGSVILFRVTGGRVYHQGLEMELSGLTVKTYGSVGFDDSLKMMAEVTVLPKLLAGTPASNNPVQIPIGGTLTHPQIDKNEVARFVQSVFQQATQGAIQGQIGRQLDQFLSPRQ